MTKFPYIPALFFASLLFLSCTDFERDNPCDEEAVNYSEDVCLELLGLTPSSSSLRTLFSSSSVTLSVFVLCDFGNGLCYEVPIDVCYIGGRQVSFCPVSSSSVPPSSSSVAIVPSSSSVEPPPVSSSVAIVPSSSSSIPSVPVFCVFSDVCTSVSSDICAAIGGTVVPSCILSSSSVPSSSSSVVIVPSSSSSAPPSSSSVVPSSSSVAPSSSSIAPSSSSLAYSGRGNNISSYRTVEIGTQTWMAENLDYVVEGSKCYNNDPARCTTYGSLYNWATAMALPSSCTSTSCSSQINSPHRGICPVGWHIPSNAEWGTLVSFVGSSAGTKLKAASGWNDYQGASGNGTDEFGFSALPGGNGYSGGSFGNVGDGGLWWSATEFGATYAYYRGMYYNYDGVNYGNYGKSGLFSVRCLQD